MAKLNCWEYKKCGRERGGARVKELGVCPATVEMKSDGVHGGKAAGRCCWAIAGTFCGGVVQGTYALKMANCEKCDFYKLVLSEEGTNLVPANALVTKTEE